MLLNKQKSKMKEMANNTEHNEQNISRSNILLFWDIWQMDSGFKNYIMT